MHDNFEASLALTMKWEGGYSDDKGDPGGKTNLGVTWREYNAWRHKQKLPIRPVRLCTKLEATEIYRENYWNAINADNLATGVDYALFDLAVNNGVGRAKQFIAKALCNTDGSPIALINYVCDRRLSYDEGLGRLWRLFGLGWGRRIKGVRAGALAEVRTSASGMAAKVAPKKDTSLRVGDAGPKVRAVQIALRAKGYPVGNIDGIYGTHTKGAVTLFQISINSAEERGVWFPAYDAALVKAPPYSTARATATEQDLHAQGDLVTATHKLMKAAISWCSLFLAIGQGTQSSADFASVIASTRDALEPIEAILQFAVHYRYGIGVCLCIGAFVIVRYLSKLRLAEYQHADFQGTFKGGK